MNRLLRNSFVLEYKEKTSKHKYDTLTEKQPHDLNRALRNTGQTTKISYDMTRLLRNSLTL